MNCEMTDAQYDRLCDEAAQLAADAQGSDHRKWFCLESEQIELDDGIPVAEWLLRWQEPGHDLRDTLLRGLAKAMARTLGNGSYTAMVDDLIIEVKTRKVHKQTSASDGRIET